MSRPGQFSINFILVFYQDDYRKMIDVFKAFREDNRYDF